ncbi:MAG: multidrug transporter AcrB [Caulobacterales bacterium 68-7]|nr:MAG: multidrug transporter AcrB [Caulobacterales bacterium 68-7]
MSDSSSKSPSPAPHESAFAISAWGIKNPIAVGVIFIALLLFGLVAYTRLPIKLFPNVTFPAVTVTVTQSGAAPAEMETQITRPIEDALASISNIDSTTSTVTQGVSTTMVSFEIGADLQAKTEEVRSKVAQARALLPREIDEPTVQRVEIDGAPILTYAVSAPGMSDVDLSWFIDDTVTRALQGEKGVAQVARVGGTNREINVVLDPDRMAGVGLTAPEINNAVASVAMDATGGRAAIGGREQSLRILGSVKTLEALRELTIPIGGGRFVKLTDVAEIGDGSSEVRGFARLDGAPVVAFQVMKTRESSDVQVEDASVKAIEKLEKEHPGVKFTRVISTVDETRAAYEATLKSLGEGMLLASLAVLLFLKDWRSTVITALAMPVSLIPTFGFMLLFGFSLNVVTLLSLTLVIGILVDDAIVEIENIEKRVSRGQRPYQAAMEGADAIGLAVVATTFSIVAVFFPVSFLSGIVGQFFKEFGITVSVAVLMSLVTARLLTPLLAAYFLKPATKPHPRPEFKGFYPKTLEWALAHRIVSCVIGGVVFVGAIVLAAVALPSGFQPPSNADYFYVKMQGPPGATAEEMDDTVQKVTKVFLDRPETAHVFAQVGSTSSGGFGGGGSSGLGDGTVTVVLKHERALKVPEIKAAAREALRSVPDARLNFQGDNGTADLVVVLTGDDGEKLAFAAEELERQMRTATDVIADPRPAAAPVGPELIITPRVDEAARLGVSVSSIASVARVATLGDIDANVAKFTVGERRIPIRVRLPADARSDLDRIRNLQVPNAVGGTTLLGSVADVSFQAGPAKIERYDRKRQMTVEGDLANGAQLGQGLAAIDKLPIMRQINAQTPQTTPGAKKPAMQGQPDPRAVGVGTAQTGDVEAFTDLFTNMIIAAVAGILMIYGVLVMLFKSVFKPAVIISALPTAISGAVLALIFTRLSISLPSMIGFLMLLGLAAKNSILLVEYAIEREREGMSQHDAIIEACRERARPIVMTSLAMMAGMLPTALGLEAGSEFRQPMAVAVIGGLITSTVLSLVVVPVVYEIVDDFERWLGPKFKRFVTPRDAPDGSQPVQLKGH